MSLISIYQDGEIVILSARPPQRTAITTATAVETMVRLRNFTWAVDNRVVAREQRLTLILEKGHRRWLNAVECQQLADDLQYALAQQSADVWDVTWGLAGVEPGQPEPLIAERREC